MLFKHCIHVLQIPQVEEEDHATGFREVHIPSWARAELRFAPEYPQFETYLRGHLDDHLRKPPKEVRWQGCCTGVWGIG